MLTRFVRTQLIIFTIASIVGILAMVLVYMQAPTLLGIGRMTVKLELPRTGGLYQFSNVTYRGVQIGKVTDVHATRAGAEATLSLDTSPKIPADLQANVLSVSAVGEQYVDLQPRSDSAPYLRDGSVITAQNTGVPQAVGPMLDQVSVLLDTIPKEKLSKLLDESFQGLNGAGDELATLFESSSTFARDFNGQRKLVRDGLLRALLAPGSSNPIAGNASLVRIGATATEYARDTAAKFVLANSARNPNRFPSSLAGQIQMVSQSLKGTLLPSRVYLPASIEQKLLDRRTSSLKDVASGKSVAIIEAQTDAEIQSALHLIETQKLNALLLGPKQLKTHIDRILKSKSTIVVQPMTASSYDWYVQDIVMAMKAGIPICFAGESAEQLRLTASMVVAAGADHDQMLSALCEIPKALLGSAAKPGIAKDEPADLVIWSGSPLNLGAKPHFVLIDGQVATTKDN